MKKNRLLLAAMAVLAAFGLVGCDENEKAEDAEREAQSRALAQNNSEKETLAAVKASLQKQDPNIKEVYLGNDDEGHKALFIHKQKEGGDIEELVLPYAVYQQMLKEATAKAAAEANKQPQQATNGGPSGMEMMMYGMAGAAMGTMLASALSNRMSGASNQFDERKRRTYSGGGANAAAMAAMNNSTNGYRQSTLSSYRSSAAASRGISSSSVSKASGSVGRSSGGSFSSSGARSGGYSSGG